MSKKKEKPVDIFQIAEITKDDLVSMGFDFEILPSGRVNLCHKKQFIVNTFMSYRAKGRWIKTFDYDMKTIMSKIKKVEFV